MFRPQHVLMAQIALNIKRDNEKRERLRRAAGNEGASEGSSAQMCSVATKPDMPIIPTGKLVPPVVKFLVSVAVATGALVVCGKLAGCSTRALVGLSVAGGALGLLSLAIAFSAARRRKIQAGSGTDNGGVA